MDVNESSESIISELRRQLAEVTTSRDKVARELADAWRRERDLQAHLDELDQRLSKEATPADTEPIFDGARISGGSEHIDVRLNDNKTLAVDGDLKLILPYRDYRFVAIPGGFTIERIPGDHYSQVKYRNPPSKALRGI